MFIFGWGTKNKTWVIPNSDQSLIASWNYIHFLFLPIAFKISWHLIGDSRSEDKKISYEEVKKIFPTNTPNINVWQKYGLILVFASLWIIGLFI